MSQLQLFSPQNELEFAIVDARLNPHKIGDMLDLVQVSDLFIPSISEVETDGSGFVPLLMAKEDMELVACFTAIDRPASVQDQASFFLRMNGSEFLHRLPQGFGVVLNPGYDCQFIMSPHRVEAEKRGE